MNRIKPRCVFGRRIDHLTFEEKRTVVGTLLRALVVSPKAGDAGAERAKMELQFFPLGSSD